MKLNELNLSNAPTNGWCMVYFKKEKPKLFSYNSLDELDKENDILEIHLFDENKEYRAISSRRKNIIETIVKDSDLDYTDTTSIIDKHSNLKKLTVRNYLSVNEKNGTLYISNYRLIPGGNK